MTYDQKQIDDLYLRVRQVLGPEASMTLARARPRLDAFPAALSRAVRAMGSPEKVTDAQVFGALEIAHEVFPVELEVISGLHAQSPRTGQD